MDQAAAASDANMLDCRIVVRRAPGISIDAWDRRRATVSVDGIDRAELNIGEEVELSVGAGAHEIGIRLQYHFAPAKMVVTLKRRQITVITCSKGSATFLDLLSPASYWQLVEGTVPRDGR